jgi:hypothetical protein
VRAKFPGAGGACATSGQGRGHGEVWTPSLPPYRVVKILHLAKNVKTSNLRPKNHSKYQNGLIAEHCRLYLSHGF